MIKNKKLLAVVTIGLLLRIVFLTHHDLWFDEAASLLISRLPLLKLLKTASFDNNPPLYYIILHFWMKISTNLVWLRLPSLIFSTAIIPAIYALANKLYSRKTAIFASLITALMPIQLYYAGEIRFYSLLIFLSTLLFYVAFSKKLKSSFLVTALLTSALLLIHYSGLITILVAVFIGYKYSRESAKSLIVSITSGILITVPWLWFSLDKPHFPPWSPNPLLSLAFMPVAATAGLVGITPPSIITTLPILPLSTVSLLALSSTWLVVNNLKRNTLLLAFSSLLAVILTSTQVRFLSPRLVLTITPLLYLGMAKSLAKSQSSPYPFFILLLIMISVSFSPTLRGPKISQAIAVAESQKSPIFHTAITSFYPARVQSPKPHYYVGPPAFPKELTNYIGGTPLITRQITSSPELVLLIDEKNTSQEILNNIQEKLQTTHALKLNKKVDTFTIQAYIREIYAISY